MAQSEKHYDFALRKIYQCIFIFVKVLYFKTYFHYVVLHQVGGLKIVDAPRQHYEGGWVGHIDRYENYVVYGQPLTY